jgi:phosphopantothenoylcysteine decarboxylase / phosphopantothenate---cysteine ligase
MNHTKLTGKHIVLGLTGGIACYKSAQLCRLLITAGATVQVVMTEAAEQFITPVTMQALSGRPVYTSQWDVREANNMPHINLSREADAVLLAPCSADFIAKLAQGRADELLSLLCLARPIDTVPLLLAPAMNREMWAHPASQRNLAQAQRDGAVMLGVGYGDQACGESGDGRMLEPEQLLEAIEAFFTPKLLQGQKVLITAGPTFEAIDPVRGITNLSSGKMGFALARAAQQAGAHVTLVAGPVSLPTPTGVTRINVQSAQDMHHAVMQAAADADIFVATAAVADWRVREVQTRKIKKQSGASESAVSTTPPALELVENADILADVARLPRAISGALFCVGFAAETEDLIANATAKRIRKNVPMLVGNLGPATFGQDDNTLVVIDAQGHTALPTASKQTLAEFLVAEIARRLPSSTSI